MSQRLGRFDTEGFFHALDATRQSRKLHWKQVAAEAGISASTLTRLAQGKRPDVDSLAALSTWAGLSVDDFLRSDKQTSAEPLAMISTYLRSDPALSEEAASALDEVVRATYERLRKA